MKSYQITAWSHELFQLQVRPGGTYIDATMGNGYDTQFLCEMAGDTGKVWAFDIQEQALKATKERLEKRGLLARAELILDSHIHMEQYVKPDSVDGIYFNFGYLPGGDHQLATKADTSVQAVETGLCLLKKGGVMALCIYSGGDTGFEEKNQILDFLRKLDSRKYIVIVNHYYNRENNPPIPAFVVKKG
ncbi:MAG TPA: class I SAM-dependent methyltransferase [Candidatus Blautia stercoravium]|nr:class I SAM-dependent methyltransferase [Candidatus Blautia stercoravium]